MYKNYLLISLCLLGFAFTAKASRDTITIEEVNVVGRKIGTQTADRYSSSTSSVSSKQTLEKLSSTSLSDYIQQQTSIYLREPGAGQRSTVSTRGTASAHTSVQWNGMPINSLTMGQTDVSLLPLFFFDQVSVQLGGESSLYGSGSIGGNISLNSNSNNHQGLSVMLQQSIRSYCNLMSGAKIGYNSKTFGSKTALFYTSAKNNFEFQNTAKYGAPTEKQNNAGFRNLGAMQNLHYNIASNQVLTLNAWYMQSMREIQPTIGNNLNPTQYDSINNQNLRVNMVHNASFGNTATLASIGYAYDKETFRKDIIATQNLMGVFEIERSLQKILRLKAGCTPQYIVPKVYSYSAGITEWRTDIYAMATADLFNHLHFNASIRKGFITDIDVPFTYTFGIGYDIVNSETHLLKIVSSYSKTFRAPSLNERYWGESINSKLEPETGKNIEGDLRYKFTESSGEFSFSLSGYSNMVTNWIRWMPYGQIMKPMNLSSVRSSGIDILANGKLKVEKITFEGTLSYSYNVATVIIGTDKNSPMNGHQIAYAPKHRGSASILPSYKNTYMYANIMYVGETHSSSIFDIIDPYTLVNISAGQKIFFGKHIFDISLSVNNLFNKAYQSVKYFAMPGRNYECTLKYYIQTN